MERLLVLLLSLQLGKVRGKAHLTTDRNLVKGTFFFSHQTVSGAGLTRTYLPTDMSHKKEAKLLYRERKRCACEDSCHVVLFLLESPGSLNAYEPHLNQAKNPLNARSVE